MRKEGLILMFSFSVVLIIIGGMLEAGVSQQRPATVTTAYTDCAEMSAYAGIPSTAGCQLKVKDYTKNGDMFVFIDEHDQQGMIPAKSIRQITPALPLPFNIFRNIYLLAGMLLLGISLILAIRKKHHTKP